MPCLQGMLLVCRMQPRTVLATGTHTSDTDDVALYLLVVRLKHRPCIWCLASLSVSFPVEHVFFGHAMAVLIIMLPNQSVCGVPHCGRKASAEVEV